MPKLLTTIVLVVSLASTTGTSALADQRSAIHNITQDTYPSSIQEAINTAINGDVIQVGPGTYNERINLSAKAITILSTDGPASTIINGHSTGSVITCASGEGPNTIINGFSITGGRATNGGGMYNSGSSPTVINCVFFVNSADNGGGVYNTGGTPRFNACGFLGNTATDPNAQGGGMFNDDSDPILVACTFNGNTAQTISTKAGSLRDAESELDIKSVDSTKGGGICNSESDPTIRECIFFANSAKRGAGVYNTDSAPTIQACQFLNNTATSWNAWGGGMYNLYSDPLIVNCIFSGNSTGDGNAQGGAVYSIRSNPTLINCTISRNFANYGGAFLNHNGTTTKLANCIIWGNSSGQIRDVSGGVTSATHCCIQGGFTGTGNIAVDPLLVDADGPDNTPGTGDDDLHLQPGSPCIDAGSNGALPPDTDDLDGDLNTTEPIPYDFAGLPRQFDDPTVTDTGSGDPPLVDMGAHENIIALGDCNANGLIDLDDLFVCVDCLTGPNTTAPQTCECCDFDTDTDIDLQDFAAFQQNFNNAKAQSGVRIPLFPLPTSRRIQGPAP